MTTRKKIAVPRYTHDEIRQCIALLEELLANHEEFIQLPNDQRIALLAVAGKLSHADKHEYRLRRNLRNRLRMQNIDAHERAARAATGIRAARTNKVFAVPPENLLRIEHAEAKYTHLLKARCCYVCKNEFRRLHFFYDSSI